MKRKHSLAYYIVIFVMVQIIWLSIAGLWISRFVINNVIFNKIGETYSIKIPDGGAVAMLVIGLSLLVLALAGMSLLFRFLNHQFNLTQLYDNFISSITHELKTPISSIQLYIDTLKKREMPAEQRMRFLENIEKDTEKLTELINNVLTVSRLEQKARIYNSQVLNCDELLQKFAADNDLNINLTIKNYVTNPQIFFDKTAFFQILTNLVDNSVKYSHEKPEILIALSRDKKWINLLYRDNGIGIPKSQRRKVFKKFYRYAERENPNVKGTGLGLYLIREMMKYHSGNIKLLKPQESRGAAFLLKFPVYKKKLAKKLMRTT